MGLHVPWTPPSCIKADIWAKVVGNERVPFSCQNPCSHQNYTGCSSVGLSRLCHYWSYCVSCSDWLWGETNLAVSTELPQKQMSFPDSITSALFFFTFPFYTTVTVIEDWRKKQLQWGTALKHSYFVPFFLMQTFHGLSTWITFWWCSRAIFARTYLIAVLSTLCNVHSLYLPYICISYMLPKKRRFYI